MTNDSRTLRYAASNDKVPDGITKNTMTTSNKILRTITLCLQIAAMLAYYVPSMVYGSSLGIAWLPIGVIQTILFCAIFFRDARTRTGLSVALMIIGTIFNFLMLVLISFFSLLGISFGLGFGTAFAYILCSTAAVIFAFCFPRRYLAHTS